MAFSAISRIPRGLFLCMILPFTAANWLENNLIGPTCGGAPVEYRNLPEYSTVVRECDKEPNYCRSLCIFSKLGVLNNHGSYMPARAKFLLKQLLPGRNSEKACELSGAFQSCSASFNYNVHLSVYSGCSSYSKLLNCFRQSSIMICEGIRAQDLLREDATLVWPAPLIPAGIRGGVVSNVYGPSAIPSANSDTRVPYNSLPNPRSPPNNQPYNPQNRLTGPPQPQNGGPRPVQPYSQLPQNQNTLPIRQGPGYQQIQTGPPRQPSGYQQPPPPQGPYLPTRQGQQLAQRPPQVQMLQQSQQPSQGLGNRQGQQLEKNLPGSGYQQNQQRSELQQISQPRIQQIQQLPAQQQTLQQQGPPQPMQIPESLNSQPPTGIPPQVQEIQPQQPPPQQSEQQQQSPQLQPPQNQPLSSRGDNPPSLESPPNPTNPKDDIVYEPYGEGSFFFLSRMRRPVHKNTENHPTEDQGQGDSQGPHENDPSQN